MPIPKIAGFIFLLGGLLYALVLGRELSRNREALRAAPGEMRLLALLEFLVFFLCTLGVSDFLLNTLIVKKLRLADDKSLPSCLIASTLVPGSLIAFSYLRAENAADTLTLLLFALCLALGAVIGAQAVQRMDGATIKRIMAYALLLSMAALILKMILSAGTTGSAVGLRGFRLLLMCLGCLGIGLINMAGVPCKPIAAAMLLLLGLSPLAALTLTFVLGCAIPMSGGVAIVKGGLYNRKLLLAAMSAGSVAAVLGTALAISLNPLLLNILLLGVMLLAVVSLFRE